MGYDEDMAVLHSAIDIAAACIYGLVQDCEISSV